MLGGIYNKGKNTSLMGDYASLLGDAVLRHRTRHAEHAARIEAELATKVKSEFISNMSHELRTPLNTVMGFSKILTEHENRKIPDNEIVEYARLIHDAARHLLSVINNILDISKMQSGKYSLDAREINIDEILTATVSSLKLMSEEAGVPVSLKMPFDLPRVKGDGVKLRQALTNLLNNALKFTHAGGSVTIEAVKRNDGGVTIYVRDTGVGMSPEEVKIALEPFGQVDAGHNRWREGTGLGLPIAKALVELHGGTLAIQSQKGMGTEVAAVLPPSHMVSVAEGRDAVLGQGRKF
jgi:two-component system cell cycle sensor histidine kinase PleC